MKSITTLIPVHVVICAPCSMCNTEHTVPVVAVRAFFLWIGFLLLHSPQTDTSFFFNICILVWRTSGHETYVCAKKLGDVERIGVDITEKKTYAAHSFTLKTVLSSIEEVGADIYHGTLMAIRIHLKHLSK